jgi:hypothetical protein
MNTLYRSTSGLIGALALAGIAFAQVPSTNDVSDGHSNTGMGTAALGGPAGSNGGYQNTASGFGALYSNMTGSGNTASGFEAMYSNTTGGNNIASGYQALYANTTGSNNTASGVAALYANTTGSNNTAVGQNALSGFEGPDSPDATGSYNTGIGATALYSYSTGGSNTASGYGALYADTTGSNNTALGVHALASTTSGSNNIAQGWHAGINLTTGSNNIDIGSPGVKAETGVIRIGTITGTTSTQSATYVAGIYGVKTGTAGTAVFIDSSGQLGTVSSSIRYKEDIRPIASASERLLKLRPVRFRYKKADASGEKPIQYGLIAEEVAKVYPELVIRDAATGRIDGVRYDELAPMLLNEMQQQHAQMAERFDAQATANAAQAGEIRDLKQQLAKLQDLNQATQVTLRKLQTQTEFIAKR